MRILVIGLLAFSLSALASAQVPRVLPVDKLPNDSRLGELKNLNGHFPFVVPDNPGAWHLRAESLRRRVLVSTGLWPMPSKTPLQSVIHGKVQRDGFTVEKVFFQSLPGHYVTGLLFRPSDPSQEKMPGVLSPHGHGGRMQAHSDDELARQLGNGAEHFRASGRMPKLARCAQLARMGCVTFIFDMLGYADSQQITRTIAHRHASARPEESNRKPGEWVFYSPQADLRLQSIMGLQTWNAVRALDFLASLPDVDPDRLAVTGGSGGGTQSILLGAIDQRIKVSFPNGMVSTSMQGGCYCENCNYLRVGTGNVELAALFAPRPQAMTAANDWTRDMMNDGYPELKWLYAMIGNEEDVYCRPMLHFKHNYNYVTRATMYQWMNRYLELGLDDPVIESDYEPLSADECAVWNDKYPAPEEAGIEHEQRVCRWLDEQANQALTELEPSDEDSLAKYRHVVGNAWQVLFDQNLPGEDVLTVDVTDRIEIGDIPVRKALLRNTANQSELPILIAGAHDADKASKVVVWTDGRGKAAGFNSDGHPTPQLKQLVNKGATVILPDLLGQGEFNANPQPLAIQRLVKDERSYSAFTYGYNRTLASQRCGDLLAVIAHAAQGETKQICLLSTDGSASWSAAAAAIAGKTIDQAIIQSDRFRFANAENYREATFVPGAVKYGDLPSLLALRAPNRTCIVGEPKVPGIVSAAYQASKASDHVSLSNKESLIDQVFAQEE